MKGKSTKDRIADILSNKAVLLETLVQWYYWFTSCMLFYFLNYGWSSFGDTPYVNYLFAGLGEAIAYLSLIPIITYVGRRKGMVFVLGMSCACFLLGMIPWQWSELWSFERLMTMASIIGVSAAFALAFLYTNELAPTTHRGLVLSSCSIIARGAAFVGPFVSEIFESSTVKLGVNAVLAGSAALICLLLPETRKLPIRNDLTYYTSIRPKYLLLQPPNTLTQL
ncbi:solute carrier family 22 member 15-like [Bolinopsis microptera]|uniref:solute carrier family 22 member 15-like n=1 Tax=Bolinopsis microptera TaxID=2820187 RepID=UPI00307A4CB2